MTAALQAAQALHAGVGIQIEVETLDQLREALDAGAESVLLDNFTEARMREAVALNAGRALLQKSPAALALTSSAGSPRPAWTASPSAS